MTKQESSGHDRPSVPAVPTRNPRPASTGSSSAPRVYSKRKVEEENGVETEENGVRPKVLFILNWYHLATYVLYQSTFIRLFVLTIGTSA